MESYSLKYVYDTWIKIFYDLVHPEGRSIYDTFWVNDRPFVSGITFICISLIILIYNILDFIIT